jgi:hypothetical protein
VGQFALAFSGQHPASECVAALDGGSIQQPLTVDDGGVKPGAFCFGAGSDGGPQVWLAIPAKQPRPSDLLPDGGFHFTGHADATSGYCGSCLIAVDESFDGFLQVAGGAGFALQADGGFPPLTGLSGTVTDQFTDVESGGACVLDGGGAGCSALNTPCSVTYTVTGSPL